MDLRIERTSSTTFALFLQSNSGIRQDTSTSNSSSPDDIEIGAEVEGTTGASIGATTFGNNEWKPAGANYYNPQDNRGIPAVNAPIQAYWLVPPTTPGSNGGSWYVKCPC